MISYLNKLLILWACFDKNHVIEAFSGLCTNIRPTDKPQRTSAVYSRCEFPEKSVFLRIMILLVYFP